ncbi:Kelch-like protein 10 [Oryzias melastigma]|uniref:Kelch-like protein 10 n=1 Tax=Oryzias melastigma TaxID=30732 RepID=A0A834FJ17_ORYME|nr:Kelch-like protein 10 [Oryzias melastigma]
MNKENSYFTFYQHRHLCDAVLKVGDAEFHVHKIILYACSPYFRNLFTLWSDPDCWIYDITDVSPETMSLIVKFFYTGFAPVTEANAKELFITADRYDIPWPHASLLQLFDSYYYPELRRKAFSYILTHFEMVAVISKQFPLLSVQHLVQIIQCDQLLVKREETVYEAILKWISYSLDERKEYISLLFPHCY